MVPEQPVKSVTATAILLVHVCIPLTPAFLSTGIFRRERFGACLLLSMTQVQSHGTRGAVHISNDKDR